MNIESSTFLVTATEAFAALVVLGSLLGILFQKPFWGKTTARLGMIGGGLSTTLLAIVLLRSDSVNSAITGNWLWTVFSIREPRPLTLVFGLKATGLTAALSSMASALFLWREWFDSGAENPSSDNARFIRRLLYPLTFSFLLALNLTQAIFSWGIASLLVILLTHQTNKSNANNSSLAAGAIPTELLETRLRRFSDIFGRVWQVLTFQIPCWLGEQAEYLAECSEPIRLLATVSGMMAILLTWLLII